MSAWADAKRELSAGASAEPGRWRTARAEFQRGIMDAINDPDVETIVVMTSSQVGKTEIILNAIGFSIDLDPSPILVVQPTLEMGQAFSKDKLAPMIRDTEELRDKVHDARGRESGNTIRHKTFDGGHLTIAGANSPASLAARSVRRVFADEVDRYPPSAGTEGDPLELAMKRATTFWNRKHIITSTPTNKGLSRIERWHSYSDQRRYFVPCIECGHEQPWDQWGYVTWEKEKRTDKDTVLGHVGNRFITQNHVHLLDTVGVECEECHFRHNETGRLAQIRLGKWRATAQFNGVAGFHLNQIISPWVPLSRMVKEFLHAKGNPELLKTWSNTAMGEPFEDEGEVTDATVLYNRRENYKKLPKKAVVLTCGVDVQDNRIECEVVAWGEGHENWGVTVAVFYGDPGTSDLWRRVDEFLLSEFEREDSVKMKIDAACVDSGGHYTQDVYRFCKARAGRNIHAIKGIGGEGKPIVLKMTKKNKMKAPLILVGVDAAKERLLLSWLKITEHGPGFCHFPMSYDHGYFEQLAAERRVTKYHKGFPHKEWVKQSGARNESLDRRVYAMAALELLNPNYRLIGDRLAPRHARSSSQQSSPLPDAAATGVGANPMQHNWAPLGAVGGDNWMGQRPF